MEIWEIKLYENNVACDIRDMYLEKLQEGKKSQDATKEILEENKELLKDMEDSPLIYFALADTQWNLGRLEKNIKKKALEYITNERKLKNKNSILDGLEQKIISNQPKTKKYQNVNYINVIGI